jgi:hypothetical protein
VDLVCKCCLLSGDPLSAVLIKVIDYQVGNIHLVDLCLRVMGIMFHPHCLPVSPVPLLQFLWWRLSVFSCVAIKILEIGLFLFHSGDWTQDLTLTGKVLYHWSILTFPSINYKQQKFTSQSFGGWELQEQGVSTQCLGRGISCFWDVAPSSIVDECYILT